MGKKRKAEVDLDAEKTLYTSFVSAANTVSQLYTQAVQQQRKIGAAAARQSLERVICFLLKEYQHVEAVPKTALLQYLQQEYEHAEGSENAPQQYPAQFLAPITQGAAPHNNEAAQETAHKAARTMSHQAPGSTPSPARRGGHHHQFTAAGSMQAALGAVAAMETAEQYSGMETTLSSTSQVQADQGFAFVSSGTFSTEPKGFGGGSHGGGHHGFGSY